MISNTSNTLIEDVQASKEIKYDKSKIKNLERLLFFDVSSNNINKYNCTNDGVLGFILRYIFFIPFIGFLKGKYFIYKYILLGLLSTINLFKLHNLVTEDYYIHKINKFVLDSTSNNKFFLGNIFGFSLYGIIEIFGLFIIYTIDTILRFFSKELDFRGLYKIKYQLPYNTNMDLFFLEKNSNIFKGYEYFKTTDRTYNIISSGKFIEKETIYGLSKGNSTSGKLRYSNTNQNDTKKKVMLANYYLNGLSMEISNKVIRIIKLNGYYKISLVFESNSLKNQTDYANNNLLLLENCFNFHNDQAFKNLDGLYFKN